MMIVLSPKDTRCVFLLSVYFMHSLSFSVQAEWEEDRVIKTPFR